MWWIHKGRVQKRDVKIIDCCRESQSVLQFVSILYFHCILNVFLLQKERPLFEEDKQVLQILITHKAIVPGWLGRKKKTTQQNSFLCGKSKALKRIYCSLRVLQPVLNRNQPAVTLDAVCSCLCVRACTEEDKGRNKGDDQCFFSGFLPSSALPLDSCRWDELAKFSQTAFRATGRLTLWAVQHAHSLAWIHKAGFTSS